MALTTDGKIAADATARQARHMLWAARKQHMMLSLLAVLPCPILMSLAQDRKTTQLILYICWFFTYFITLQVLWLRLFLYGRIFFELSGSRLFKMCLRLMGYYLGLGLVLGLGGLLLFGAWIGLDWLWRITLNLNEPLFSTVTEETGSLAFTLLAMLVTMRLILAPVGIAIDEHISLRQSWSITKGNTYRLLETMFQVEGYSIFLISIITLIFFSITIGTTCLLVGVPKAFETLASPIGLASILFILSPFYNAAYALPIAVMAIIYRDLVPQPEHLVDVTV